VTTLSLATKESAQERDLINVRVVENAVVEGVHQLRALKDEIQSCRKPGLGPTSAHGNPC